MEQHSRLNGKSLSNRIGYDFTGRSADHSSHHSYQSGASTIDRVVDADTIRETVETFIKRSPAKSLLVAVAAGLAIGWLVKR